MTKSLHMEVHGIESPKSPKIPRKRKGRKHRRQPIAITEYDPVFAPYRAATANSGSPIR